jgi:RHS repeat-associated protein
MHYDAYCNAIGFDPSVALTEFLYSGEQFDSKIGQQYLRARYYDPSTGRFNRLDPFFGNLDDPQSFHKYLYTHDNPINGIDPSGEMSLGSVSMACAIGGAMIGTSLGGYIGYSQTGQIFSGKTIGYAILGGLAGFGIGAAIGAMIGHISGATIGLNPSTVFYTSCKVIPKIYSQSMRLLQTGKLGLGNSKAMLTFAVGILSGIVVALTTPDEIKEEVSVTSLSTVAAGSNLDILYRTATKYVYKVKYPYAPGYIPPALQLAQVFVLGFNLGYFGTQSVEHWIGGEE